jgi:DNA-binding NarL/FixJ family response regulator
MCSSLVAGSNAIGVLVADSNRMQSLLLTNALRRRAEFRVLTCPVDVDSILKTLAFHPVGVLLVSINHAFDIASQIAAMRQVHLSSPAVAKVLLTEAYDRELVINAFRSGVRGIFCLTDTHFRLLCRCIQRVADGQVWINTEQTNYLLDLVTEVPSMRVVNSRGGQMLTPREAQVVALVAEGMSNRDTARELKLSEHTVKKYLFRIFDKLGVSSRVELVLYAVHHLDSRQASLRTGIKHPVPNA